MMKKKMTRMFRLSKMEKKMMKRMKNQRKRKWSRPYRKPKHSVEIRMVCSIITKTI